MRDDCRFASTELPVINSFLPDFKALKTDHLLVKMSAELHGVIV